MLKKTAGIIAYRWTGKNHTEIFLVHPGGPYWAEKEYSSWTLPKGEFEDEEPLAAAIREFKEETGHHLEGEFRPLLPKKITRTKVLYAFTVETEIDHTSISSNIFRLEWPPKSGEICEFPEADRAAWFAMKEALKRITNGQIQILKDFMALMESDAIENTTDLNEVN